MQSSNTVCSLDRSGAMTSPVDLLGLQQTATGAFASLLEYAEILARVASALQITDARPAALTAAALAAAAGAAAAQDDEVRPLRRSPQ